MLASKPDVFIFKAPTLLSLIRSPTLNQNTFEPMSFCRHLFLFKNTVIFSTSFSPAPHLTLDQLSMGTKCLPGVISFHRISFHCNPQMELALEMEMEAAAIHSFLSTEMKPVAKTCHIVKEKTLNSNQ